jgi:HEAT repeat protein
VARGHALLAVGLIDPPSLDGASVLDDCADVEQSARRFARSLDAESARTAVVRTAVVQFITIPIGTLDADNNADPIASRALWSEQIARQFPCVIPTIVEALTKEHALGDWLAEVLWRVGKDHPEVATLLVPLLDHESDAVRVEAFYALALSERMPVDVLPRLIVALREYDGDRGRLDTALLHMAELHPREVIAALIATFGAEGLDLFDYIDMVGSRSSEIVVEELTRLLDSTAADVRRAAASRLMALRAEAIQAVPRLRELLDDQDPVVQDTARSAIRQIQSYKGRSA